jgi:hypothetical protein
MHAVMAQRAHQRQYSQFAESVDADLLNGG